MELSVVSRLLKIEEARWRTLHEKVTDEKDGDGRVVLDTLEVEVLLQRVEACLRQGVAVEVVEKVHCPKNWLSSSVKVPSR